MVIEEEASGYLITSLEAKASNGYEPVGKNYKGLTDNRIKEITEELKKIKD